jgi:hypothetical protein
MFYQYSYATCFDHNFGHHQGLNEHLLINQTHWIQYYIFLLPFITDNLDNQEKHI